jgi:hypothetical protein
MPVEYATGRKADMIGRGAGGEGKEGMEEGSRGEYKGYDAAVDSAKGELSRTGSVKAELTL